MNAKTLKMGKPGKVGEGGRTPHSDIKSVLTSRICAGRHSTDLETGTVVLTPRKI